MRRFSVRLATVFVCLFAYSFASSAGGQTPTPEPSPSPEASPDPEPSPSPEATPSPDAAPSPEASPSPVASPLPPASPTPTPDPCPSPSPTPKPKPPPWSGSLEAGATLTSGNTHVETYTGSLKVDGKWRGTGVAVRAGGVYAETANTQTAGLFDSSLRAERTAYSRLKIYGRISIDGDRFKGVNSRKGAGTGVSLEWSAKDPADPALVKDRLRLELGSQYYREDLALTKVDRDVVAIRGFFAFHHAFGKDTGFSEELETTYDFHGRYLATSVTGLALRLRNNIAFKLTETVKVDTKPNFIDPTNEALGRFERIDTLTAAAIIITF